MMFKLFWSRAKKLKPRAPRDAVRCTATMCTGDAFHRVGLSDISSSGCKVSLEVAQEPGRSVQIALESFHSLNGTVRWCRDGVAGIQFTHKLSDPVLARWREAIARGTGATASRSAPQRPSRDFWGDQIKPT